jgi:hypothetical protein
MSDIFGVIWIAEGDVCRHWSKETKEREKDLDSYAV